MRNARERWQPWLSSLSPAFAPSPSTWSLESLNRFCRISWQQIGSTKPQKKDVQKRKKVLPENPCSSKWPGLTAKEVLMRMKSTREITTWKHAQSVDVASLVLEFNTWWVLHLMFCMWNKVDFHAPQTSAILILHNIASYFSRQQKIPRTPQYYCTRPGRQSHFIALSGVWRKWNAARPNTNGHSIGFSAPKPRENSETEGIMCQFARKRVDSIFFHRCRSEKISKK